jgi:MAF protein
MTDQIHLVLASNSPRRRQLIALAGWAYSVLPADVDERTVPGEAAPDYVERLARSKALAVGALVQVKQLGDTANVYVVGADTTVVQSGQILGKPGSPEEAWEMLVRLRGQTHQVYTGVSVLRLGDGMLFSEVCATDVPMRSYSDEEIAAYIASGDPMDKAGAYAIQNREFHPVTALSGCYANVVGLPLCHLTRLMERAGARPHPGTPAACQADLGYACDIYTKVLALK